MIRRFGLIGAVVVLSTFSHCGILRGEELTIVYTANSSGKLTDCNCPTDPYGGLAERVTLIKDLRVLIEPFLLVDSGNMVSLFGDYDGKAACVMRLMNLMKYDAGGFGINELFNGLTSAEKMSAAADFPLISAVFALSGQTTSAFKPYAITEIGGITAGIVSVCDSISQTRLGNPRVDDYRILLAEDALRPMLTELSHRCDFTIVLSELSSDQNRALIEQFPAIDLVVEGYGNRKYVTPETTQHGIIVSPGNRGQFVGLITLEKTGTGTRSVKYHEFIPVLDIPADEDALKIIAEYEKSAY